MASCYALQNVACHFVHILYRPLSYNVTIPIDQEVTMRKTVWDDVLAEQMTSDFQTAANDMELSGARALVLTGNPAWADTIGPLLRQEGMAYQFVTSSQLFDRM